MSERASIGCEPLKPSARTKMSLLGEITSCYATPQPVTAKLATSLEQYDSSRQAWMETSGRVAISFSSSWNCLPTMLNRNTLSSRSWLAATSTTFDFGAGKPPHLHEHRYEFTSARWRSSMSDWAGRKFKSASPIVTKQLGIAVFFWSDSTIAKPGMPPLIESPFSDDVLQTMFYRVCSGFVSIVSRFPFISFVRVQLKSKF